MTLAACGGSSGGSGGSNNDTAKKLFFVHAIPDAANLNLFFLNSNETVNSGSASEVGYAQASAVTISNLPVFQTVGAQNTYRAGLRCPQSNLCGIDSDNDEIDLADDHMLTIATGSVSNNASGDSFTAIPWTSNQASSSQASLLFVHAAYMYDSVAVDIYILPPEQAVGGTPAASSLGFTDSNSTTIPANTPRRIVITEQAEPTEILFDSGELSIPGNQTLAVIALNNPAGDGVQVLLLNRSTNATELLTDVRNAPQIRAVNAFSTSEDIVVQVGTRSEDETEYSSTTFIANASGNLLDTNIPQNTYYLLPRGVATSRISYELAEGSNNAYFRIADSFNDASSSADITLEFNPDSDNLLVATGFGANDLKSFPNDRRSIANAAKVRVINAGTAEYEVFLLPRGADVNAGTVCPPGPGFCIPLPTYAAEGAYAAGTASDYFLLEAGELDVVIADRVAFPNKGEIARAELDLEDGNVLSLILAAGNTNDPLSPTLVVLDERFEPPLF